MLRRLVVRVLQLQHVRSLHQVGILLLLLLLVMLVMLLLLLLLEVLLLLLLLRVGRRPRGRNGRVREAPSLLLLLLHPRRRQWRMHRILSEVTTA